MLPGSVHPGNNRVPGNNLKSGGFVRDRKSSFAVSSKEFLLELASKKDSDIEKGDWFWKSIPDEYIKRLKDVYNVH